MHAAKHVEANETVCGLQSQSPAMILVNLRRAPICNIVCLQFAMRTPPVLSPHGTAGQVVRTARPPLRPTGMVMDGAAAQGP